MKTALVTGASGGIGLATVKCLLRDGYLVIGQYCKNVTPLLPLLTEYEDRFRVLQGDFSTLSSVEEFIKTLKCGYPNIDVLVNNAGVSHTAMYGDHTDEDIMRVSFINLTAPMLITRALLPHMICERAGSIINVTSVFGLIGGSLEVAYSAAKAGLIGFTKALAKEVGLSCVLVNAVAPGFIHTAMTSALSEEDKNDFLQGVALGRAGEAMEVAEVIAFLASDKSSYMTGQILSVDGLV